VAGRTLTLPLLNCKRSGFDPRHQVYSGAKGKWSEGGARQNGLVDRIVLQGMAFSGRHGVGAAEREHAQRFKVDVELDVDLSEAGRTDRLEDTIDYRQVRAIAKEAIEGESVKLIETLAARIAERALAFPKVRAVTVRIAKRPASMSPIEAAAVHISRTRA
jgi:dihydroneopterin aldolase